MLNRAVRTMSFELHCFYYLAFCKHHLHFRGKIPIHEPVSTTSFQQRGIVVHIKCKMIIYIVQGYMSWLLTQNHGGEGTSKFTIYAPAYCADEAKKIK